MREKYDIVIVGGGIAGISAARRIAQSERSVSTLLVCGEDRPPYKRTKISKSIARGFATDEFALEEEAWYQGNNIDVRLDAPAMSVDTEAKRLRLADGATVGYSALILATGGEAIPPADIPKDHPRVHTIRRARDVERLISAVGRTSSIAVLGMGVLGVEVAEQMATMAKETLLLGRSHRLMPRELNPSAARRLSDLFRRAGVEPAFGTEVDRVEAHDSGVDILAAGETRRVDHIVYCVGMRPAGEIARVAGIPTATGILVDDHLATEVQDVYACGDVAEHRDGYRTHLWHAAELQGEIAAANALGESVRYDRPSFRLKCEVFDHYFFSAGYPGEDAASAYEVLEIDSDDRYLCFYFQGGLLSGVIMIDDKDKAKTYQQAIRERWQRGRVERELIG